MINDEIVAFTMACISESAAILGAPVLSSASGEGPGPSCSKPDYKLTVD